MRDRGPRNVIFTSLMILAEHVRYNYKTTRGRKGLAAAVNSAIATLFPPITDDTPPQYRNKPTPDELSGKFKMTDYSIDYSWHEQFEGLFVQYKDNREVYTALDEIADRVKKLELYPRLIRDESMPGDVVAARKIITDTLAKVHRLPAAMRGNAEQKPSPKAD